MLWSPKRTFIGSKLSHYLAVFVLIAGFAQPAVANQCNGAIHELLGRALGQSKANKRNLSEIPELKMGTYNTFNLTESADGRFLKTDEQKKGIADAILANDLDVAVLQEVEGLDKLEAYCKDYLGDRYIPYITTGNDARGIQVAFLVKRDLPFKIQLESHVNTQALYPATGQVRKIFSRDLPSLRIWADTQNAKTEDPLIVLYGTHFKSKRTDDPNDPLSTILRGAQVKAAVDIIARDKKAHPNSMMMIAGDFNGEVSHEIEFAPLREKMVDAFDALKKPLTEAERVTHSYHPRGGETEYGQIDAFFIWRDVMNFVEETFVHRYRDATGRIKEIPKTFEERELNPSDHFPVILKMKFRQMLEKRGVIKNAVQPPVMQGNERGAA